MFSPRRLMQSLNSVYKNKLPVAVAIACVSGVKPEVTPCLDRFIRHAGVTGHKAPGLFRTYHHFTGAAIGYRCIGVRIAYLDLKISIINFVSIVQGDACKS